MYQIPQHMDRSSQFEHGMIINMRFIVSFLLLFIRILDAALSITVYRSIYRVRNQHIRVLQLHH